MKALTKQRGFSFTGFIVVAFLLIFVAIFSMKLIPYYMENGKVQKAMDAMVRDPALQSATTEEIKMAFYKRAVSMDNVTIMSENDLEVIKEGNRLMLSASYKVVVPLGGNVSLLIQFNPSAPK